MIIKAHLFAHINLITGRVERFDIYSDSAPTSNLNSLLIKLPEFVGVGYSYGEACENLKKNLKLTLEAGYWGVGFNPIRNAISRLCLDDDGEVLEYRSPFAKE
jgi:hypothetical protein